MGLMSLISPMSPMSPISPIHDIHRNFPQETRDYDAHPTISDQVIRIVIVGSGALVLDRDNRATESRDQREALRLRAARQPPLGKGRLLRLGQPGLERVVLRACAGPAGEDGCGGRRLSGSGAGSE